LSTVLAADRIAVMDEGRVVDIGIHSELLGRCDVYRRLAQTQLMPG
jgi:ATP-binding cassette subfamily B protein